MKRFILLIFNFIILSAMQAQEGLHINTVFEGKVIDKDKMVETLIMGEQLSRYNLTAFHCVKFTASSEQRDAIEKLFKMDIEDHGKNLISNENCEMELRNGHLFYAIAEVKSQSPFLMRYISYQCSSTTVSNNRHNITLVCIDGRCKLQQLKKFFKN